MIVNLNCQEDNCQSSSLVPYCPDNIILQALSQHITVWQTKKLSQIMEH